MARPPSPLAALRHLFARSNRPMYALDERQRLVFANDAMAEWTGVPVDQLLGLSCTYLPAETAREALAASLAPPPPAILEGRRRVALRVPVPDGNGLLWRQRQATVLVWDQEHELAAVFLMLDASDLDAEPADETEADRLRNFAVQMRKELPSHSTLHLMGESALMRRVRQQVGMAGATSASVLIVGPTGTGREEVANAIYYGGVGGTGIVPLSCRLLDAELLSNALEDLERSQYELVEGPDAILLLDVDQMPLESQGPIYQRLKELDPAPKLLATSSALLSDPNGGPDFHQDFAAFLSEIVIQLPALVDRPEDIPPLAESVLHELNRKRKVPLVRFDSEALDLLVAYPWFENHRELRQLVLEAGNAAIGTVVRTGDLPPPIHAAFQQAAHPSREEQPVDLPAMIEEFEREMIQRALKLAKGNKSQAARLLSLRRSRLLRRIEALKIESD